jgi:hypothetical protein
MGDQWMGDQWMGDQWMGYQWMDDQWMGDQWMGYQWMGDQWMGEYYKSIPHAQPLALVSAAANTRWWYQRAKASQGYSLSWERRQLLTTPPGSRTEGVLMEGGDSVGVSVWETCRAPQWPYK